MEHFVEFEDVCKYYQTGSVCMERIRNPGQSINKEFPDLHRTLSWVAAERRSGIGVSEASLGCSPE